VRGATSDATPSPPLPPPPVVSAPTIACADRIGDGNWTGPGGSWEWDAAARDECGGNNASRPKNLGDLCDRAHLRHALHWHADANKNIVIAVSNAASSPAFVEMTSWYVKDLKRTQTPYLFLALTDEQCEGIEQIIVAAEERAPHISKPRCGVCRTGLPTEIPLQDHMMLMRLRYTLLSDTVHLGYNGLVSDIDIIFHANPFVYLDQLKEYAMTVMMEGFPVKANSGVFFARGDTDPSGAERHVAKKILSDFVQRQAWPHEHPDEFIGKIYINFQDGVKRSMDDVCQAMGLSPSGLIEHATNDQDMLQDVLDSASASGFTESRVYRGLRQRLEQQRGNQSGVEKLGKESSQSQAVGRSDDLSKLPIFSETARRTFGCYPRDGNPQMKWVELRDGDHQVERLLAAPTWLVEGPGGGSQCFENPDLVPSAIRHCVGKNPECLYPARWRPGAWPEGWCGEQRCPSKTRN